MSGEPEVGVGMVRAVTAAVDQMEAETAVDGPAPLSALDHAAGAGSVCEAVRGLLAGTAPAQVPARLRELLARVEAEATVEAGLPAAELDRREGAATAAARVRAALGRSDERASHDTSGSVIADAAEARHAVTEPAAAMVGTVAEDAAEWGA